MKRTIFKLFQSEESRYHRHGPKPRKKKSQQAVKKAEKAVLYSRLFSVRTYWENHALRLKCYKRNMKMPQKKQGCTTKRRQKFHRLLHLKPNRHLRWVGSVCVKSLDCLRDCFSEITSETSSQKTIAERLGFRVIPQHFSIIILSHLPFISFDMDKQLHSIETPISAAAQWFSDSIFKTVEQPRIPNNTLKSGSLLGNKRASFSCRPKCRW